MSENRLKVYDDVPNWWYHYYSCTADEQIGSISPSCFLLASYKYTPDFENYRYEYGICHYQIGADVVPGKSIVLLKTATGASAPALGCMEKAQFITGYFRVAAVNRNEEYIEMDKQDSLLLLDNPIKIGKSWARKLFPEKVESYWDTNLVRKIGSVTRNRHIHASELSVALKELHRRLAKGGTNYLGNRYRLLRVSAAKKINI